MARIDWSYQHQQHQRRNSSRPLPIDIRKWLSERVHWYTMFRHSSVHILRICLSHLHGYYSYYFVTIWICRNVCSWLCDLAEVRCGTSSQIYISVCLNGPTASDTCSGEMTLLLSMMGLLILILLWMFDDYQKLMVNF